MTFTRDLQYIHPTAASIRAGFVTSQLYHTVEDKHWHGHSRNIRCSARLYNDGRYRCTITADGAPTQDFSGVGLPFEEFLTFVNLYEAYFALPVAERVGGPWSEVQP